jgi:serine/threonine protein kinase
LGQKIDLMLKVILTVDFLHQRRMIHRDLKPGNILVGPDLEPKVLDFGLAAQVDDLGERLTKAGEITGTPDYFSPEQAQGSAPHVTDE